MPEPFKLYLDQMFALDVARALRHEDHDIIRASEVGQARADDQLILDKAIAEKRILVTLDEHFGDWVILPTPRCNSIEDQSYHIRKCCKASPAILARSFSRAI